MAQEQKRVQERCSESALFVYIGCSMVANILVILVVVSCDFDDSHPPRGSPGEMRHLTSNVAFLLPIIPCVIRGDIVGSFARERMRSLVLYSVVMGVSSCLHHSFEYDPDEIYKGSEIPLLWRSIDWGLSRLVTPACLFVLLNPVALARVAGGWSLRVAVEVVTGCSFGGIVIHSASQMALDPFSMHSFAVTTAIGAMTLFLLVSPMLCVSPVRMALGEHFLGSNVSLVRTLHLGMCILAALLTRLEGDDSNGWVHLMWHFATASIISGVVAIAFDESAYCSDDKGFPEAHHRAREGQL